MSGALERIPRHSPMHDFLFDDRRLGGIVKLNPLRRFFVVPELDPEFLLVLFRPPDGLNGVIVGFAHPAVGLSKFTKRSIHEFLHEHHGANEKADQHEAPTELSENRSCDSSFLLASIPHRHDDHGARRAAERERENGLTIDIAPPQRDKFLNELHDDDTPCAEMVLLWESQRHCSRPFESPNYPVPPCIGRGGVNDRPALYPRRNECQKLCGGQARKAGSKRPGRTTIFL